ncbi:MAG: pteridine reductase [Gammaproteobacteria bacterium]|jgi:pteridine reductase|nr:pteridine reductase [Gammaproteobacteria bacterium]
MTEFPLAGQTALVTGGARRIGAAIVRRLHAAGAKVIIHYHQSHREAVALALELNQQRADSAFLVSANLLQTDLSVMMQQVLAYDKGLDILVNNASLFYPTYLEWDVGAVQALMQVNAFAPYQLALLAKAALEKRQGAIINLVDIHAEKPLRDYSVYSQSKAALRQQTMSLAKELAPQIRVNAIAPGAILWPEDKAALTEAQKEALLTMIPLQRLGRAEDIAQAVLYLATAVYVTGVILPVEGGRLLVK